MFREHQPSFYDLAFRTPESMVLKAGDTHDIVLGHVNQDHFTAARHTTHRTHSY
jgi:hypothetical protein